MRIFLTLSTLLIGGWLLGGCAMSAKTAVDDSEAVSCPECKTVWVTSSRRNPKGMLVYRFDREMTCPTCDEMAVAYLEDGSVVLHECPDCKTTPTVTRASRPASHLLHKHQ